jgi:nitrogen fixation-related uncharacterized protein
MKIYPITILIIGISVAIVALAVGLFQFFIPNWTRKGQYEEYRDQLQAEADKLPQAEERVENAIDDVEALAEDWAVVVAVKTPPQNVASGGIDLSVNPAQLTVDSVDFRNSIQRAVNQQMKRGGVEVIQGVSVPSPTQDERAILSTYYNYPAYDFPVVIFDLGTVTVEGTFSQIVQNVNGWAAMPNYLAFADGLTLQGLAPSQTLVASYNLTLVGFLRYDTIAPAFPGGATLAGAGGGGAPAGGFGGPGGMGGPAAVGGPPPGIGGAATMGN